MRAGARLFAEHGVEGVQIKDIVAAAGQRNASALHYHFRSREGLADAIVAKYMLEHEQMLGDLLDDIPERDLSLETIVRTLIRARIHHLDTDEGRAFLRLAPSRVAGLAAQDRAARLADFRDRPGARPTDRAYHLVWLGLADIPEQERAHRMLVVITSLLYAIAGRAAAIDAGQSCSSRTWTTSLRTSFGWGAAPCARRRSRRRNEPPGHGARRQSGPLARRVSLRRRHATREYWCLRICTGRADGGNGGY